MSAFVGLVNVTNVWGAVEQLQALPDWENKANIASALTSMGGAINSGLNTFSHTLPNSVGKFTNTRVGRALAGRLAARAFGHGGAFLTGLTLSIRGGKRLQENDTDAGMYYAAAAITATVGGALMTESLILLAAGAAAGPIGLLVLSIALVVGSIILENKALDAMDQAIEIWLDNCTFGVHLRKGPGAKRYPTLEEETAAMVEALYTPQVASVKWDDRWGWDNYFTAVEIFVPGFDPQESKLIVTVDETVLSNIDSELTSGGRIFKYAYNPLKHRDKEDDTTDICAIENDPKEKYEKEKHRVCYHISYQPSSDFKMLKRIVHLPKDEQ